jgi:hypothetical protein
MLFWLLNLLVGFANSCSGIPSCSTPPPAFEDAVRGDTPPRHRNPHHVRSYREESVRYVKKILEIKKRLRICAAQNKEPSASF